MYDFVETRAETSAITEWDGDVFGGTLSGNTGEQDSVRSHRLESERAWELMSDQFTNVSLFVRALQSS